MKKINLIKISLFAACFFGAAFTTFGQNTCGKTDYDCQVNYYRGQISNGSKDVELYYNLALALQNKGDIGASIDPLDMYVASTAPKPEYRADAYNLRGWAQQQLGKDEIAIQDFSRAIELFPKTYFYRNRGKSYSNLGKFDLGIADATKAIELDPKQGLAYFNRGLAYMQQKNNPPAIADFTKVMELDPDEYEAFYNRGTLYYRQQQYEPAIKDLDKYLTMNVKDQGNLSDGYNNRGLAKYYLGKTTEAIADFTKAIELVPDKKKAYTNRAMAYRKLGKTGLADADDQKAASLN